MASFSLPPIQDNPDGAWGPSTTNFPEQFKFKDIPYAPYSKSDKLGRFADWNELGTDNRQQAVGGLPSAQANRGGRGGGRRDGQQAFGTGTASAFASFQVEDESNFSVVDNRTGPVRRPGQSNRGRGMARGGGYAARGGGRGGRGGFNTTRGGGPGGGGGQRGGRRGWRDWEKVCNMTKSIFSMISYIYRQEGHVNLLSRSRLSGLCWRRSSSFASTNFVSMSESLKTCACPQLTAE
jgi:translation initiation factor 3 subunit D